MPKNAHGEQHGANAGGHVHVKLIEVGGDVVRPAAGCAHALDGVWAVPLHEIAGQDEQSADHGDEEPKAGRSLGTGRAGLCVVVEVVVPTVVMGVVVGFRVFDSEELMRHGVSPG